MDIRFQLAEDVACQIGAQLDVRRCPDCVHPLLIKPEQGLPFCWFCTTDRVSAQRARTTLLKARLASKGIFLEERVQGPVVRSADPDHDVRCWPDGMAL